MNYRIIKFRGKRVDNGEWVYGTYHYSNCGSYHYILSREKLLPYEDTLYLHSKEVSIVDPETVGQFTGLKDKDGRGIYEGDIVRANKGGVDVITYDEIAFNMCIAYSSAPKGKCVQFFGENNPLAGIKIIGNIHDNSDLIKPKE